MKYLLDTHVLLWWLTKPKKLSKKAHAIIADRNNDIVVSSVSFWEMAIKSSIGRLVIPRNVVKLIEEQSIDVISLSAQEALSVVDLPDQHKDPFDRMLVAQAKYNNLVLITKDKILKEYPVAIVYA